MTEGRAGPAQRWLLISGSLRPGSTNTAVLRTLAELAPSQVTCVRFDGAATLPYFSPDLDGAPPPPPVSRLRDEVHAADALVVCTPEYAGALPSVLKNLLEWLIGDEHLRSLYRKPVVWLNASGGPTGARDTHASLGLVLGYAHAELLTELCRHLPVTRSMIGPTGAIADADVRAAVAAYAAELSDSIGAGGPAG